MNSTVQHWSYNHQKDSIHDRNHASRMVILEAPTNKDDYHLCLHGLEYGYRSRSRIHLIFFSRTRDTPKYYIIQPIPLIFYNQWRLKVLSKFMNKIGALFLGLQKCVSSVNVQLNMPFTDPIALNECQTNILCTLSIHNNRSPFANNHIDKQTFWLNKNRTMRTSFWKNSPQ